MKASLSEVLEQAGAFFMKRSPIHEAALRMATTLQEMEIPFVVVGALAVNAHGHVRTTGDVDILLTPDGLAKFKARWLGRGWVEVFAGSRGLRDAVTGVKIDILLTGDYPGDGRPKPIRFPDPSQAMQLDSDGLPILTLPKLLEMKLASGMTAAHRPRDLDDVIQLVRVNELARDYSAILDPYVQAKFDELWAAAQVSEDY
jgi:hypothetical protein